MFGVGARFLPLCEHAILSLIIAESNPMYHLGVVGLLSDLSMRLP